MINMNLFLMEKIINNILPNNLGSASSSVQGGKRESATSHSQSGKPIVSAIINMPVAEAI